MKRHLTNVFLERGIFGINFFFVIMMILTFYFQWNLELFFYSLIFTTLVLSYLMFSKFRVFSKGIILSNLFVYFYFLYPYIGVFSTQYFPQISTYILILYTLFLSYILLEFLGKKEEILKTIPNISVTPIVFVFLGSFLVGAIFFFVGEPIPKEIFSIEQGATNLILYILFLAFLIGISEQLLFTGFLFQTYKTMTSEMEAQIQTSILFVAFHMLRIQAVIASFVLVYGSNAYFYMTLYFLALFLFMNISILLYRGFTFKGKQIKGSFTYSVIFHTLVDFTLIYLIIV